MIVANATGCSSIYGANLPTTPWTVNAQGRGPAWNNSLFEDNAEFGLGMRLGLDAQNDQARRAARRSSPRRSGPSSSRPSSRPTRTPRPGSTRSARGVAELRDILGALDRRVPLGRASPARARRRPRPQGRLDRRRRRLGLRHRLRRPRPRPRLRPQRQRPGPRHRGLLQHRRPGIEGHAARRGREVRGGRQGTRQEGPRRDAPRPTATCYVAQIAMGANDAQTVKAPARGGCLARARRSSSPTAPASPTASTCRSRCRTRRTPSRAATGRSTGSSPSEVDEGQPFKLDSKAPSMPVGDFVAERDPVRDPRPHEPGAGGHLAALAQADVDERWRYYEQLAGMHRSVPHVHNGPDARPIADGPGGTDDRRRGVTVDLRTRYLGLDLRSPIVASASPLTGEPDSAAASRRAGRRRSSCRRSSRRRSSSRRSSSTGRSRQGTDSFAEALDYFPNVAVVRRRRRTATWPGSTRSRRQSAIPVIASLNATHAGRLGALRASSMQDAGADALELNLYHLAADPARRPPISRPPTWS